MAFIEVYPSPYVAKFLISNRPIAMFLARTLLRILEDVLIHYSRLTLTSAPEAVASLIFDAFKLIFECLAFSIEGQVTPSLDIPYPRRLSLVNTLLQGASVLSFSDAGAGCRTLAGIIDGEPASIQEALKIRDAHMGLEACVRPGCEVNRYLYQCATCMTAVYCGREHQRDHWFDEKDPHKARCFKTNY